MSMGIHPLAGKPVPDKQMLVDVGVLERAYFEQRPDPDDPAKLVQFGTSGHRGTSLNGTFTQYHIRAITQAICDYRRAHGIDGPLFVGKDTHALSRLAERTALEVLLANGVDVFVQRQDGFVPTPVISRAIIVHNRARPKHPADGIVITPSHNPPEDGGFKYNPPHGGPAETAVTKWIQDRANDLLRSGLREVKLTAFDGSRKPENLREHDFLLPYVRDLGAVLDMDLIRSAGVRFAVDPMGGSALRVWELIAEFWRLEVTIVNMELDPTFRFIPLDHDGRIRMDCSSPFVMSGLVDRINTCGVALAVGNDPDADRHGIVTSSHGLMNPNHYLAVAIDYLIRTRPRWLPNTMVGKTVVSSSLIDRVVAASGKRLFEVPVGFKWFATGLLDGALCFGGEESAGASFLQWDGSAWTTDKDGIVLGLLAAEILARTGQDPGLHYEALVSRLGRPYYKRLDLPVSPEQKAAIGAIRPEQVTEVELAGEPITAKLITAPGNGAPIGGIKIVTPNGWLAIRPSGTENICKVYAESFKDEAHLNRILSEAQLLILTVLR